MQAMKIIFALTVAATFGQAASETQSPVTKAVELLTQLSAKITAEGEKAKQIQAEFAEFCKDRSKDLGFEIKTGAAQVSTLQAAIEDHTAQAASFSTKVEELVASLASDDADLTAAKGVRAKEAADFDAETKELNEVIDTLQRAIGILEREMQKGGASMMQVKNAGSMAQAFAALVQASTLSSADASKLTALVQASQQAGDEDDDASLGAPAAAVYQSQSGNIVDTLEELLDKARDQLRDAQKTEGGALHAFQMVEQSLADSITYANKDMAAAKGSLSAVREKKAAAEGDLASTSKELEADKVALTDLKNDCAQKAKDYAAAAKSRAEELAALAEATRVINDMTGNAAKLTYGLNQVSLLQESQSSSARSEVVRFLRVLARKHNAPALAQLASRVANVMRAGDDVFAKVKGLISDLIDKLETEAGADATVKAFCDSETSKSEAAKDEHTSTIEGLTTKIDQMSAQSAQLKEDIGVLQKELAKLAAAQALMNKLRLEEHSAFVQNKIDMDSGVQGIQLALRVLRDYYASDGKAHEAAEGSSSSIVGILEVAESDFTRDLASMVVAEDTAQADYETQTKQNEIEKVTKDQDVKYKTKEAASLDKTVSEVSADRDTVAAELAAVEEYLDKLHDRCVPKAETYAERKARRQTEIAGLKQALEILEGQSSLVQMKQSLRGVRTHRRF